MKRGWISGLITLAALLAGGCVRDTANVTDYPVLFFAVEITGVTPADPAGLFGDEDATFTASSTAGVAPVSYEWDFGGAATPNRAASPAGATTSLTRKLTYSATQQDYTVTVTATDALGRKATDSVTIAVGTETDRGWTVIDAATYDAAARVLIVVASSPDDDQVLSVTLTLPPGVLADALTKQATATGPLRAEFHLWPADILSGATGAVGVTVSSQRMSTTFAGGVAVNIPPVAVPADTLVAVPLAASAAVGAPVDVAVITGPTANPFEYLIGCGLTIESDASFVHGSFDKGTPDDTPDHGNAIPVDGIWLDLGATRFLLDADSFIEPVDLGGGRERWDFNVTPLDAVAVAGASGMLFNLKFTFASPGVKTFGFQEQSGPKRTYYADDATEYFWGDITNDGTVAPNSVTIR